MDMRQAFKPGFKDKLVRYGIQQRLGGFAIAAGFPQARLGVERTQALIGEGHRQVETALQTFGELGRQARHLVRRSVGMRRQTDNQLRRLPFGDQLADRSKTVIVRFGMDGRQWMGSPRFPGATMPPKSKARTAPAAHA
jgi:hypothetical protein